MKAIIFDIERNSFVDGPGIRTTVFFKGCNLKCVWCHNPESQNAKPQMMFYRDKCKDCGKCKAVCKYNLEKCDLCGKCTFYCPVDARKVCGKEYTVDEVFSEIIKDKSYYENSGGGVTFSGGECMLQIDFLCEILKMCNNVGIHTAVDTAGCVPYESFEKVAPFTDLFLYDIKAFSEDLHKDGTGSSNKLILENIEKLSKNYNGEIIVRIPIIGGFNDDTKEIQKIAEFLKPLNIRDVELLPYHKMGENKYDAINKECVAYKVPSKEKMKTFKNFFKS